jgi:ATP-binding cassette subfamily C protein/ATP-binding cassette subfamily C protein LapB
MIAAGSLMADGSQGLDRFVRSLAAGSGDLPSGSTYAACLAPLLKALGWRGESRHLIEAMPHCATDLDLVDLRNIVANLGFRSRALPRV